MRGAGRCARHLLPSPETGDDRAAAVPAQACPGVERGGARRGLRRAVLAALRGSRSRGGVRDAAGRRRPPVFGAHDVPDPGREPGGAGAPGAAQPSEPPEARGRGARAQRGVVLGRHAASRAEEGAAPVPLRDPGHLQPLRHGLDGGGARDGGPGGTLDRGALPRAGRPARRAHPSPTGVLP